MYAELELLVLSNEGRPAAEWRSKEGKSLSGLPAYEESLGLQRTQDGEHDPAAAASKRQRLDQASGELSVPLRQIAAPEDDGLETQERVPIPRSSL